jgi:transcriptional regulator with XRE-family HTH domain
MADNARAVRVRLGKTVQRLRLARGWSQEQFAERSGITNKYISLIELGKINPTLDKLAAIAKGLSISLSELFAAGHVGAGARVYVITQSEVDQLDALRRIVERVKRSRSPRTRAANG